MNAHHFRKIRLGIVLTALVFIFSSLCADATVIITDAETGEPLPKASIFDSKGCFIAITEDNGAVPTTVEAAAYPLNIRYVGYVPIEVSAPDAGIVAMLKNTYELPEIVVDNAERHLLHVLAYERSYEYEYTIADTLLRFTERMVDFVFPLSKKVKFKGWQNARKLAERQYIHNVKYRKEVKGDTLIYKENTSARGHNYFYALADKYEVPEDLVNGASSKVVVDGKYSPKATWSKVGKNYFLATDDLADKKDHVWAPAILKLLGLSLEFTRMEFLYKFSADATGSITPDMMDEVAYYLNFIGKGKFIKKAMRQSEPVPVQCYGELYVVDRAYLTDEEAKALQKNPPSVAVDTFQAPPHIPAPPAEFIRLKAEIMASNPDAH